MVFAIRGVFRGLLQEVFGIVGLVGGVWAAGWVSRWVGAQWLGAQPAVAFFLLRWVVIVACGLACAGLSSWWGRKLSEALHDMWAGWVDRAGGAIAGTAIGFVIATFVLLAMLMAPWPSRLAEAGAEARLAVPLMQGGVTACRLVGDTFPGSDWLRRRFLAARARALSFGTAA